MNGKQTFDERAAVWDEKPERVELAKAVAMAISDAVRPDSGMKAFEYGCGTGLLGFFMKPYTGRLVMADTSRGMLEVAEKKIEEGGYSDVSVMRIDLSVEKTPDEKFDLVFSQMTLHHINDFRPVIEKFYKMLNPGGHVCIADLEKEDGSFHEEGETVHDGIDSALLAEILSETGFTDIYARYVHIIKKNGREYPVFLMHGKKQAS